MTMALMKISLKHGLIIKAEMLAQFKGLSIAPRQKQLLMLIMMNKTPFSLQMWGSYRRVAGSQKAHMRQ
jgi:hypothetical protein